MRIKEVDEVIELISKFIDEQFGYDLDCEDDFDYGVAGVIETTLKNAGIENKVYFGVTKLVIVLDDYDYVIKIPFNGQYYESDCDWSDDDDFHDDWYPFECADRYAEGFSSWDYCDVELGRYKKAVTAGFKQFFLDTQFYCNIDNGHPIYIQKKAVSIQEGGKGNSSEESRKEAKENSKEYHYMDCSWVATALDVYGKDLVLKFIDFLRANNYDTDLHRGNIGFTNEGLPVLIDWAGWYDEL